MAKTIYLKVTSAFLVAGKIAKVGEVVEVGESDAKSLLHRGKAVLVEIDPEQAAAEAKPQAEAKPKAEAKGGKKGK